MRVAHRIASAKPFPTSAHLARYPRRPLTRANAAPAVVAPEPPQDLSGLILYGQG